MKVCLFIIYQRKTNGFFFSSFSCLPSFLSSLVKFVPFESHTSIATFWKCLQVIFVLIDKSHRGIQQGFHLQEEEGGSARPCPLQPAVPSLRSCRAPHLQWLQPQAGRFWRYSLRFALHNADGQVKEIVLLRFKGGCRFCTQLCTA